MTHVSEDELVLHHYGDGDDRAAVESHLAACADCRLTYDALLADLALTSAVGVPEPADDFEARVWARLEPELPGRKRAVIRNWHLLGMAASLLLAFLLGRQWPRAAEPVAAAPGVVRERVVLVALGDHLDRSQMVLMEIANADPTESLDMRAERAVVGDLVSENRLYRQTLARDGDSGVASVLEEVERVLLELAHSPDTLAGDELVELQRRIEARGLVFKVRVTGSRVRERQKQATGAPPAVIS